jgi:hypothetical protein
MTRHSDSREFLSDRAWVRPQEPRLDASELDQAIAEQRLVVAQTQGINTPATGKAWEQLGVLLLQRSHFDAAQWSLETASTLVPLSHAGQLALAECYVDSGFVETARSIYRYLAAAIRIDSELLEPLAEGLGRVGERDLALDVCREAAQRLPRAAGPLLGIAYYLRPSQFGLSHCPGLDAARHRPQRRRRRPARRTAGCSAGMRTFAHHDASRI